MGTPMATNLIKQGHAVKGFDLVTDNLAKAVARGVAKSASAEEAATDVDAVVTMLPAGKDTLAVWGGGLLQAAAPGMLLIDSSTIDVGSARAAHRLAADAGMLSLDAPVSGGVGGAEAATLTFMCGGTEQAFAAAKPILEAMGKRVVHCGEAGAGQAAKICNNMILGISMIGVCEAFVLAEKLGLSHQALFDVASTSSGQCWSITSYCPVPGPVRRHPPTTPTRRACLGLDAEGSEARPGGGVGGRRHHTARRGRSAGLCHAQRLGRGRHGFFRDHSFDQG
jgi:3-hydroxyisobutyrate dehydrogenase